MKYLLIALMSLLLLGAAPPAKEVDLDLVLEKVTASFDAKTLILVQQKDNKMKVYRAHEHKEFEKYVEENDLDITEFHIVSGKVKLLVFRKKVD